VGLSDNDERLSALIAEEMETANGDSAGASLNGLRSLSNERGVALVMVLWIFVFLLVVAFDFSVSVREEGLATHRYSEGTEGYYLAMAGFEEALYHLIVKDTKGGRRDGPRADERTLRLIFTNLGVGEFEIGILVDSILDWRDEDDFHRVNGAESDYYLSLSSPYAARNGPFDTVEDLLWVRGVTPDLFFGLEKDGIRTVGLQAVFTVDSRFNRVNLRTASAEVIHALMGLPVEKSRGFVEERDNLSEKSLMDLLKLLGLGSGEAAARQFAFVNPSVITIEAMGYHFDSTFPRQLKGVVRVIGGNRGFELVRWVDWSMGISRRGEE
jgi:general secretion pathway protein K